MEILHRGAGNYNSADKEHNKPRLVGELVTGRNARDSTGGGQCWQVALADDGSRLAWSAGFGKLVVLPYSVCRNLLPEGSPDEEGSERLAEKVTINCRLAITCVAFGTASPQAFQGSYGRCYWQQGDDERRLVLATGHENGRIRVWDPYTGEMVLELTDHRKPVRCLAFSSDGRIKLASGSDDSTIKVWDMADGGNMIKTLKEHQHPVRSLAWSPDGSLLCSVGKNQKAMLWSTSPYRLLHRLSGHFNDVTSVAFSPDGALVATASADTRVLLWDAATGERLQELNHEEPSPGVIYMSGPNNTAVLSVAFAPCGTQLATVAKDGKIRFWSISGGRPLAEVSGLEKAPKDDAMLHCAYSARGGALAVGYASGNALLFSTPASLPSLLHMTRSTLRSLLPLAAPLHHLELPRSLHPYLAYRS